MKGLCLAILGVAVAQFAFALEFGKMTRLGDVTIYPIFQSGTPVGMPKGISVTPGIMLAISTTNPQTTDFVVIVNFKDDRSPIIGATPRSKGDSPTNIWLPCDPKAAASIVVEEKKAISSQKFN